MPFEWRRLPLLLTVLAAVAVGGELLLPTDGLEGWVTRTAAIGVVPLLLLATRFLTPQEVERLRALRRR